MFKSWLQRTKEDKVGGERQSDGKTERLSQRDRERERIYEYESLIV